MRASFLQHHDKKLANAAMTVLVASSLWLILLMGERSVCGLDPRSAASQYVHDAWNQKQGLPQESILAIAQTPDGYLWLGTQAGLVRFDGVRFRLFDSSNTVAISANMITALFCDRSGTLWIGTAGGGLVRMRAGVFRSWKVRDGLSNDFVQSLCEDREGHLWIGTTSGLNRMFNETFLSSAAQASLQGKEIWSLAAAPAGALWIGTRTDGLYRLEKGMLHPVVQEGLANVQIGGIVLDRTGKVWVGTEKGLYCRENSAFKLIAMDSQIPSSNIVALLEDRDGNLWLGTRDQGVLRFRDGRFSQFSQQQGLPSAWIYSLFEDREGNLWIGMYDGGLSRIKDGPVMTWGKAEGLGADMVMATCAAREGGVWAGLSNGDVIRVTDQSIRSFSVRDGLTGRAIQAIAEDQAGNLWVGTDRGLCRFEASVIDPGQRRIFTRADGLPDDWIFAIHTDREGKLWVSARNHGLSLLRGNRFLNFSKQDGLADDFVTIIRDRAQGGLWIGTLGGLSTYQGGRFTNLTSQQGLSGDSISAIYEGDDGALWIGTAGSGLNVMVGTQLRAFHKKDGIPNETIFQLLPDAEGHLWCGSERGIFRLANAGAQSISRQHSIAIMELGIGEGMRTLTCTGIPGGARSSDGLLWFPTVKGLSMVNPAASTAPLPAVPVFLEDLSVDGVSVTLGDSLQLPPATARLRFQYTGLFLGTPERLRFRYLLEGYDRDWTLAGAQRFADYTGLPPGDFRFRVMVENGNGLWTEPGAIFTFSKRPWFYQTWWFVALCIAMLFGLTWAMYRLRLRQLRAQHAAVLNERTRMARELHDTLVQGYVGIGTILETAMRHLQQSPDMARRQVEVARRVARHSLTESRRAVSDLRSEWLLDLNLRDAIRQTAAEAVLRGDVKLSFDASGDAPSLKMEAEQQILRIVQEAVNNSIRHADPENIDVKMQSRVDHIEIRIADNGKGFAIERAFSPMDGHFGLIGMRERANRLHGRLQLESRPGQGTEITLVVPISENL